MNSANLNKALRNGAHSKTLNSKLRGIALPRNDAFIISCRHKVASPRLTRSRQEVSKMDFRWKNRGQFDQSGHEDESYSNLDWTAPESEFLSNVDEGLIANTYVEYSNHWMRKFMKFTDAEFESFNIGNAGSGTEGNDQIKSETTGYSRIPEDDADEISQSLQYLDEWKRNLKTRKLEDDYEVKLPNGMIVPYKEYLDSLDDDGKKRNDKKQGQHSEAKLARMRMHAEFYKREPVHDEYGMFREERERERVNDNGLNVDCCYEMNAKGRSHGEGWRKSARAKAMVYEGDGSIFVNGKHFGEYFKNYVDRMNVMIPFLVTDMDRKLNAWCTVEGGGSSGQSGAIREAVAKAVGFYQPTLYPYLHAYKLTTRDWRKRERKKPGKPKARKSHRWTRR